MKIEKIGEFLQDVYDHEIDLHIGYLWDGGFDFAIHNHFTGLAGIQESEIIKTGETDIEKAFDVIAKAIEEKYEYALFVDKYLDN